MILNTASQSSPYFGDGLNLPGAVQSAATGTVCVGSINNIPIFAESSIAQGPPPFFGPSFGERGQASLASVATARATGLICVGSVYGAPVFAPPAAVGTAGQALAPSAVHSAASASIPLNPAAAQGLICIGSMHGVPLFAAPQAAAQIAPSASSGQFTRTDGAIGANGMRTAGMCV